MDLLTASRFNDIDTVNNLLCNGTNVNVTNACQQTALNLACRYGHHEVAEKLLAANADPELGYKPLIAAAKYGRRKCIELLRRYSANVNSTDKDGRSALLTACLQRDYATMELLLEFGADVNIRFSSAKRESCLAEVLFSNAGRDQLRLVEKLLDKGMLLQPGDPAVLAASRYAFKYGFRDFGLKMLELETDDNVRSCYTFALVACALYNWPDIATTLLQRGVNANSVVADLTALSVACREEHPEVVEVLLRHGANPNLCIENAKSFFSLPPLEVAVSFGNIAIVKLLLSKGARIVRQNSGIGHVDNAFHIAVARGNYCELGQLLLDSHAATINCSDMDGRTALHRAARLCNVEAVNWLIKQHANVNAVDRWKRTALHLACGLSGSKPNTTGTAISIDDRHRLAVVKLLLQRRVKLNTVSRKKGAQAATTALFLAAKNGFADVVAALLAAGARYDIHLDSHPLLVACQNGHFSVVELLLANGVDPNMRSHPTIPTPLYTAVTSRRCDLIKLLLDNGASVNEIHTEDNITMPTVYAPLIAMVELLAMEECPKTKHMKCNGSEIHWGLFMMMLGTVRNVDIVGGIAGETAFHKACSLGLTDAARQLLQHGASINKLTDADKSALYLACSEGREDTVRFLLENKANIKMIHSKKGVYYWPLIMAATWGDNLSVVKLLLSYPDVDVNERSSCGETALHVAQSRPVAECLLEAGANPRMTDDLDKTPLDAACGRGHVGVVEALLTAGVSPNRNGGHPQLPLFVAVEKNYIDVAKVLLAHGANPDQPTPTDNCRNVSSVLCHAIYKGNLTAVSLLLEAGALVNDATENKRIPLHCALRALNRNPWCTLPPKSFSPEQLEIIDLLLTYGADVNAVNSDETALYSASLLGLKDVVLKLLQRGADLDLISRLKLKSPLFAAGQSGNYNIVSLLLSQCAGDINRLVRSVPSPSTLLGLAAKHAYVDIVDLLLVHGADAMLCDDSSLNTPLHFAVRGTGSYRKPNSVKKVIKSLLAASADVNAVNILGETPLGFAYTLRSIWIVELLLVNGADPKKISGDALVKAVSRPGGMALLELLLAHGADINTRDSQQRTVLHHLLSQIGEKENCTGTARQRTHLRRSIQHVASCESLMSGVSFCMSLHVDVNAVDCTHKTALYLGVENHLCEIVRLLLANDADPTASNKCNVPLCRACDDGSAEMVKLLLEYGASPNARAASDSSRTYPLISASLDPSKLNIGKMLLDHGAKMNVRDCNGKTALHHAIVCNVELAKFLVDSGADVNLISNPGKPHRLTPLHIACNCEQSDIVVQLLSHGAYVNQKRSPVRPLLVACRNFSPKIAELLLSSGADPNLPSSFVGSCFLFPSSFPTVKRRDLMCKGGEGILPLCVVAFAGRYEFVKLLLNHGAKVNAIYRPTGIAALHAAVVGAGKVSTLADHLNVVSMLLDSGADVNLADGNNNTPLFKAIANGGCIEVVDLLLLRGADPNIGANPRHMPCDKCSGDHSSQVEIMLGASLITQYPHPVGKNNLRKDCCPSLPLGCAAFCGLLDVVRSLLKHGADVNACDNEGLTALHQTCKRFRLAFRTTDEQEIDSLFRCMTFLLENGADVNVLSPSGRSVLGLVLTVDCHPRWIIDHRHKMVFVAVIGEFIRHGAHIDDSPQNLPSVNSAVCLSNFLDINMQFGQFVVELIEAGAGFCILSQCIRLLNSTINSSVSVSSITTDVVRAMILAGCRFSVADMEELQMADVWIPDVVAPRPNRRKALENSAKVEFFHWMNEHRPLSLLQLSCNAIRSRLFVANGHRDIRPRVSSLPLPEAMKQFVAFRGHLADASFSDLLIIPRDTIRVYSRNDFVSDDSSFHSGDTGDSEMEWEEEEY